MVGNLNSEVRTRKRMQSLMRKATKTSLRSLAEKRAKVVPRYGAAHNNSPQSTHKPPVTEKKTLWFERNVIC